MTKNLLCTYASLNANSLIKTDSKQTQSEYIRYLRLRKYDIICFQETRASTQGLMDSLNIRFQPNASYWSKHVRILSFSPSFQLTRIDTSNLFEDDRFQLCKIEHPQGFYEPFFILNIYARANSDQNRREFFDKLTNMLYGLDDQIAFDRLIISGDFNYSYQRHRSLARTTSNEWRSLLNRFFFNSMVMNDLDDIPTFQRTNVGVVVTSTIDYIYLGRHLHQQLQDTSIHRLCSDWSDHSILQTSFKVGTSPTGPGLWRANPVYASHPALQHQIVNKVNRLMMHFAKHCSNMSPEDKWDQVKTATKKVIKNYGYSYVNWRTETIRQLERKRNRILRTKPPLALRTQLTTPIDLQLGQLQKELSSVEALKAGIRWREHGEKSAGFLKRLHQQRTVQQLMTEVKRPLRSQANIVVETAHPEDRASDPATMRDIVRQYYQQLYNTDPVQTICRPSASKKQCLRKIMRF
jgi:exonuclease III